MIFSSSWYLRAHLDLLLSSGPSEGPPDFPVTPKLVGNSVGMKIISSASREVDHLNRSHKISVKDLIR